MEPTIYKPSIYKGPTIYNTGAGGGGGGPIIGGWPFDGKYNMVDNSSSAVEKSNGLIIDLADSCFYRKERKTSTSYFDNRGCPRYYRSGGIITRSDDFEMSVDFKLGDEAPIFPGGEVILQGTTTSYNSPGSCSIDINYTSNIIVFLMANNIAWGNVNHAISVTNDAINISNLSSKINNVTVKHYADTDDFEIWFNGLQSEQSKKTMPSVSYGGSCDNVLGGIMDHLNSISNNGGKIYFSSYVKYNGDFLPLA